MWMEYVNQPATHVPANQQCEFVSIEILMPNFGMVWDNLPRCCNVVFISRLINRSHWKIRSSASDRHQNPLQPFKFWFEVGCEGCREIPIRSERTCLVQRVLTTKQQDVYPVTYQSFSEGASTFQTLSTGSFPTDINYSLYAIDI